MKYYKFEKIIKGDNPIIRVTFKTSNWLGKQKIIVRDICQSQSIPEYWKFCDNGDLTHNFDPINVFHKNENNVYVINES